MFKDDAVYVQCEFKTKEYIGKYVLKRIVLQCGPLFTAL